MVEIDFETLVSAISEGLDRGLTVLFEDDFVDLDEAVKRCRHDIIREIRMVFDKAEAIAEIEERFRTLQQEMLQLESQIGNLIQAGMVTGADKP